MSILSIAGAIVATGSALISGTNTTTATLEQIYQFESISRVYQDNHSGDNCKHSLPAIAYAFAKKETSLWTAWVGKSVNNWFSMKKGSGKYWPIYFEQGEQKTNPSWYRVYDNSSYSIYDFMDLIVRWYKCDLSKKNLSRYLWWDASAYHNQIHRFIKEYENLWLVSIDSTSSTTWSQI